MQFNRKFGIHVGVLFLLLVGAFKPTFVLAIPPFDQMEAGLTGFALLTSGTLTQISGAADMGATLTPLAFGAIIGAGGETLENLDNFRRTVADSAPGKK